MITKPLIELQDLAIGYSSPVLSGIKLTLQRSSFTGVLGSNGSGKSTLMKTLLGIIPPLSGRMIFNGENDQPPALGYVPQRETLDSVFPLSCFETVLMGQCGRVGPGRRMGKAEREWALYCLEATGAGQLRNRPFSQLSGGQKQRVLIARALAAKPQFLLLDEPTAGIDTAATQSIMELLRSFHQREKLTVMMVSHDLAAVRKTVEQVIWIHEGKLLHGPVGELLSREKLESVMQLEFQ